MKYLTERVMKFTFLLAACTSILAVALICVFLFSSGIPAIGKIGVSDFLLGMKWKPLNDLYGIFPMIVGSIYVTAGALVIGVPIGILCAVFMAHFCPKKLYAILKPAINLLAGIPSIVYGFFGLVVLVR
jgi:phosphate transport system permease protein